MRRPLGVPFLALLALRPGACDENGTRPTAVPTAVPTSLPSPAPTFLPAGCNASACLTSLNGGKNFTEDATCCSRRVDASCLDGAAASFGEACGTDAQGRTQYETCCARAADGSGSDDDGLTTTEELIIGLVFGIFGSIVFVCFLRGTYYFIASGCKYPDGLGAVGSTVYYDERRGQCFGLIIFFTVFTFITLIFTYMAASDDADMLESFAMVRLQMKNPDAFVVVGLTGYAVFAGETDSGGTFFEFSDDYGKDSRIGDREDFDWTGECETAGQQAIDMLVPVCLAKIAAAVLIYFRNDPNTDGVLSKLGGAFLELFIGLMILAMLLAYSLRCYAELPTGKIFLPDDSVSFSYYDPPDTEYGDDYTIRFRIPYTSFVTVLLSGLMSFYIAWVHWRMSTWGSELVDKDFY